MNSTRVIVHSRRVRSPVVYVRRQSSLANGVELLSDIEPNPIQFPRIGGLDFDPTP